MTDQWILSENDYMNQMDTLVVPYLNKRKKEIYLQRETEKKIYTVSYRADSPKGIMLISHGFTESAEKYREMAYYFVREGYHTIIMEHCGHGRSYRLVKDPSLIHIDKYERYVDDLLFVAHTVHIKYPKLPFYLFGHSMGGGIAAAAAGTEPMLFHRIILSSPMIRPSTENVPWYVAYAISALCCLTGKSTSYVIGQKPYQGPETFTVSSVVSEARFTYYQKIRDREPLFHMNGASYGWLHEAARLNSFLRTKGWKRIKVPVLMFQAGQDTFVSNKEQDRFMDKLTRKNDISSGQDKSVPTFQLVRIPQSKHEIYTSRSEVLNDYWEKIFEFLT